MTSDHGLDRQDELLIAVALSELAREWATTEPVNTERACELGRGISRATGSICRRNLRLD